MKPEFFGPSKFIPARTMKLWRLAAVFLIAAGLSIASAPTFSQKNKKDQNRQPATSAPILPMTDEATLETEISEMLATWQIGDTDRMQNYYADDVLVVSGGWEPPIIGWTNYRASYLTQRAHMQSAHLERTNTAIKVTGDTAWATYQWEFNGVVDNSATIARGHSTLVFARRNGHWLIVLNHTSIAPENSAPPPAKTGTP